MNRLDVSKRAQVVSCLVEGNSIRATVRMTGVAKNTVVRLLCDLGRACSDYQDKAFRNLPCETNPVRRNLELHRSEGKELHCGKESEGRWRYLDVDGD